MIEPLTDPTRFGGNAADAFHVVCPSLPGFAFSGKPAGTGWGVDRIARAWMALMARLGYDRYGAQGGDWGSAVTTAIGGLDPGHCAGIHVTLAMDTRPRVEGEPTAEEQRALQGLKHYRQWDSGYSKQQATRPQSLAYGLTDSPAGQAAWILEKFWAWTDCDGHPENIFSRDELLDNVMLYWVTACAASSARLYWESFGKGGERLPVDIPTGVAVFPKEIVTPVRQLDGATLSKYPALEGDAQGRTLRRIRATGNLRGRDAGVLPDAPVVTPFLRLRHSPCSTLLDFLRALPKAELHCHLLGTVRQDTFTELARREQAPLDAAEIEAFYTRGEKPVGVLRVSRALDAWLLRGADDLHRITDEYRQDAASHTVRYAEFFWNPTGTARQSGIAYPLAQQAILRAVADAQADFGITGRLVPAIDREASPEEAVEMVGWVIGNRRDEVPGIGMDYREVDRPPELLRKLTPMRARPACGPPHTRASSGCPGAMCERPSICCRLTASTTATRLSTTPSSRPTAPRGELCSRWWRPIRIPTTCRRPPWAAGPSDSPDAAVGPAHPPQHRRSCAAPRDADAGMAHDGARLRLRPGRPARLHAQWPRRGLDRPGGTTAPARRMGRELRQLALRYGISNGSLMMFRRIALSLAMVAALVVSAAVRAQSAWPAASQSPSSCRSAPAGASTSPRGCWRRDCPIG